MRSQCLLFGATLGLLAVLGGCTVHPPGERAERESALKAGEEIGRTQTLPENPTSDDLVHYALLSSAELEQRYWEWRSAIEQIPQDGTQATNLAISAGTTLNNGSFSRDRTSVGVLNDPMADIVWPQKLSVAARRALENARAAGLRFQKAKFDLRYRVLSAYFDYALTAELVRLEESNAQLLRTTGTVIDARNRAGKVGQQDLLKSQNEIDLSANDVESLKAQLPTLRAALNALLNREPAAVLPIPDRLPTTRPMDYSDAQILALAAKQNPELAALAAEVRGRADGIKLARLQYMPDFSLSAATDLGGITQALGGMVTIPAFKHEAINAAVAQAEANLKSMEAMRRQNQSDLNARIVMDLITLRDAGRQLELFGHTILPRARQVVAIVRSGYESGQSTLLDVLDSQRSLIAMERLVANLQIVRERRLADLEAVAGMKLEP